MPDLHSEGWRDAINKKKGLDIHHIRKAFKVLGYFVGFDVSPQNTFCFAKCNCGKCRGMVIFSFLQWLGRYHAITAAFLEQFQG